MNARKDRLFGENIREAIRVLGGIMKKCKHCKPCEHKNLEYCKCCDKVVCNDCDETWGKPHQNPYLYPYVFTPSVWPYEWNYTTSDSVTYTVADIGTTTDGQLSCGHK